MGRDKIPVIAVHNFSEADKGVTGIPFSEMSSTKQHSNRNSLCLLENRDLHPACKYDINALVGQSSLSRHELHDGCKEALPPPKPPFDRTRPSTESTNASRVLSLFNLSAPKQLWQPDEEIVRTGITRCVPSLNSSRSAHNRNVGRLLLAETKEPGHDKTSRSVQALVQEFDTLLVAL